jgi:hypothetical protein
MPSRFRREGIAVALAAFAFLAAATATMVWQLRPPAPLGRTTPAVEFSAERAADHVKAVARAPHPTGSHESARVADYIVAQLRGLRLETSEQLATCIGDSGPRQPTVVARVRNVLGRMRSPAGGAAALLFVTHYDSVPTGPGASDDGSGIATLLETARALRAGTPPRNDIIFLFTDGEELGLVGARAFAEEHPWAKDVAVVINFEARGVSGPSVMFETSGGNEALISEFADGAIHPVASSVFADIYRHLRNDTDFTVFRRAGLAGLNFAYLGDWPRYHTTGDSVANLDLGSLQHHGSYALALARRLGSATLPLPASGDSVYFAVFRSLLHYSTRWVRPLTSVMVLLFLVVVAVAFAKRRLSWRTFPAGLAVWPACTVLSAGVAQISWTALTKTSFVSLLPYGMAYNSELCAWGFAALTVAIVATAFVLMKDRVGLDSLTAGALAWWTLCAVLSDVYVPGGSYLFAWPTLFGLLGFACCLTWNVKRVGRVAMVWAVPTLAVVLVFAPIPYLLIAMLSTVGLVAVVAMTVFLLAFLAPLIGALTGPSRWAPVAGAVAVTAVLFGVAGSRSRYDDAHPQATGVFYSLDSEDGTARFVTVDRSLNDWTSAFMKGPLQHDRLGRFTPMDAPVLVAAAAPVLVEPPAVTVLGDVTEGEQRTLNIRVRSPRRARAMWVSVRGCQIQSAVLDGRALTDSKRDFFSIYYVGVPEDGFELTLGTRVADRPEMRLADVSDGLPAAPDPIPARPARLMPSPAFVIDSTTMVSKTFKFRDPQGKHQLSIRTFRPFR